MLGYIINGKIITNEQGDDELHYYGVLANQKSFIWVQTDHIIITFVEHQNKSLVHSNLAKKVKEKSYHSKTGSPLDLYYFKSKENLNQFVFQSQNKNFSDQNNSVDFLESDVSPLYRFLSEHQIRGIVKFKTSPSKSEEGLEVFKNPHFENFEFEKNLQLDNSLKDIPKLKTLSIDIETNAFPFSQIEKSKLYSIALATDTFSKVLMIGDENKKEDYIEYYTNEKDLLVAFKNHFQNLNPQIIIGWNVIDFDFKVLIHKFLRYEVPLQLGINHLSLQYQEFQNDRLKINIPGRVILDGIPLVKTFSEKKYSSYSLENISQELLQAGKIISEKGQGKIDQINKLFLEDKKKLAEYNLKDTVLVLQIFEKLHLTEIQYYRTLLSGVFIEGLHFYNDIIDNLYLPRLHRLRLAVENQNSHKKTINFDVNIEKVENQFLKDIVQIEFEELFESVIKTYHIDPVGMIWGIKYPEDSISEEGLTPFHKKIGILAKVYHEIEQLENTASSKNHEREDVFTMPFEKAIAEHKKNLQQILIEERKNVYLSRYTTSPFVRSLKNYQKNIILSTTKYLKQMGLKIVCSDLKNIFYCKNSNQNEKSKDIIKLIKEYWENYFEKKNLKSHLKLKIKNEYEYFYLPKQPIVYEQYHVIEFKGKDTTQQWYENIKSKKTIPFIHTLTQKTIDVIFGNEDIKDFFHQIKKELQNGQYDNELIYQKRYNAKQQSKEGTKADYLVAAENHYGVNKIPKRIPYVVGIEGIEIFSETEKNNFDYNHYLEKEIVPHIDKILSDTDYHQHIKVLDPKDDGQMTFF